MNKYELYDTWWHKHPDGDQGMEDSHIPHWERIIPMILETDLSQLSILDFGCNQGGFLRMLYQQRPFKRAVGIDLARKSVEVANQRKGDLPAEYLTAESLDAFENQFDLAISIAVIYLIPDLVDHARQIKWALKTGGVYYTTFGDDMNNPSFPKFKRNINSMATIQMQYHTLDDVVAAFEQEGFRVTVQRYVPAYYLDVSSNDDFYHSIADRMKARYEQSYIFRMVAPAV